MPYINLIVLGLHALALLLSFSFFHNMFYYGMRGEMGIINYHWWFSQSKQSTAKINLTLKDRSIMLLAAITIEILIHINC